MFTILSILSLLLGLATLALWCRSYWHGDAIYRKANEMLGLQSVAGELCFSVTGEGGSSPAEWSYNTDMVHVATLRNWAYLRPDLASGFFLGFGAVVPDYHVYPFRAIAVPHWSVALLFAMLPAFHLRAMLRPRWRDRLGLCRVCGYNLRATPERCPECGTVNDQFPNQNDQSSPKPQ